MNEPELKPCCPFCSKKVYISPNQPNVVRCSNYLCPIGHVWMTADEWNTRPAAEGREEVEELRKELRETQEERQKFEDNWNVTVGQLEQSRESYEKAFKEVGRLAGELQTSLAQLATLTRQLAEEKGRQWQSIETAPMDGTEILLTRFLQGKPGKIDLGAWEAVPHEEQVFDWCTNWGEVENPSHWCSAPTISAARAQDGEKEGK